MWYGQTLPWMQARAPMTPGAGMPPHGQAPIAMQPRPFQPGGALSAPQPPLVMPRPLNPADIGMLAALLAQQTRKPSAAAPAIVPGAQAAVDQSGTAQGVSYGATPPQPAGLLGLLARLFEAR